jgi:adenine/guanine phosphoribosyltransferase-like PRPP-binding protein
MRIKKQKNKTFLKSPKKKESISFKKSLTEQNITKGSMKLGHNAVLHVGLVDRRNLDQRSYKVLMNASGDSREFAIVPKNLRIIAKRLAAYLQISKQPDYIIGFAPGGIPIAVALAYELNVPLIIAYKCRLDLPDEITWSEPHCLFNTFYLYGIHSGMSVILVDDEVDNGNTLCNAVRKIRAHGIRVLDVACVVEVLHNGYSMGRAKLLDLNLHLKSLLRVDVDKYKK